MVEIPTIFRQLLRSGLIVAVMAISLLVSSMNAKNTVLDEGKDSDWSTEFDSVFVDEMQSRALVFFIEHSDPVTGLTRDRAPASGAASDSPASIAATGFALSAWCIGDYRGWITHEEAIQRTVTALQFIFDHVEQEHGWLYHYINIHTGRREWKCEASTIDTALFLKGALLAREFFGDAQITKLVDAIYARIDWQWALNGGSTLSHGWLPESGFLKSRWDSYSELLGLYLLGIGAPDHALPASTWRAWRRGPVVTYGAHTFIDCPALFTHQYAHAWFDFRGRRDEYADYWQNSVSATLAQREWCATFATAFKHWSLNLWGVTASDSVKGYVAWGGPNGAGHPLDGTLVPCAPAGSLPFAPQECLESLKQMRSVGGSAVWGRYGFVDAFNPQTGWVSSDVIAIDLGITLLMAENLRSGFVWTYFMRAPEARRGLALAGFRETPLPLPAQMGVALAQH